MKSPAVVLIAAVLLVLIGAVVLLTSPPDRPPAPSPADPGKTAPPAPTEPGPVAEPETGAEPEPDAAAEPKAADGGCVVTVVSLEDGSPIEGAQVELETDDRSRTLGRTDASGTLRLDETPEKSARVRARAAGFVRSELTKPRAELRFALQRGLTIAGAVVDRTDRRPLAGVTVVLTTGGSLPNRSLTTFEPPLGRAVTDAGGRFAFDIVPPGMIISLTARLEGYESATTSLELAAGAEAAKEVTLEIAPGGGVSGVVLTPDGAPVEGATVYAIPADGGDMLLSEPDAEVSGGGRTWRSIRAKSGAGGRYEITGLSIGGSYVLRAKAEGFAPSADVTGVVPTADRPSLVHDLRLRETGAAVIRLRGPDGEPVAKAKALWWGTGWPEDHPPDETGTIRLEGLSPGPHTIRVEPEGLLSKEVEFTVESGKTAEVVVSLEAGVALAGVVVDDRGRPVPGAKVEAMRPLHRDYRDLPRSSAKAVADEEGRFRIEGLLPGPHGVKADADGHSSYWNGPFPTPSEGIEVRAPRYGKLTVKLVLPAGAPAPERIWIVHSGRTRNEAFWGMSGRSSSGSGGPWNGGVYEDEFVPPGDVEIVLRVEGYAPVRRSFRVAPGETVDLGEIPLGPGFTVTGRVVDRAGAPVEGASVAASQPMVDYDAIATAADGSFRIEALGAGETEIVVEADGFLEHERKVDAKAGAAPLLVRLDRGGLVEGMVADAEGKPVAAAEIAVIGADGEEMDWYDTDHRGRFSARLPEGEYRFRASDGVGHEATADAKLTEGGRTPVRIVLGGD